MKTKIKHIRILEYITIFIYTVLVNYYADLMVERGFIIKNFIYLIVFSFVLIGGAFILGRLFNKISEKISKKM